MKTIIILLSTIFLTSCSKNDSLALIMEASFEEQFVLACNENKKCINAAESYVEICFKKELAIEAINAEADKKKQINTKHILLVEGCLSKQSGKNYWKEINMPSYILTKVNK